MNEWSVIVMLITLGGGIIALVRPIVTLTKAITELTVTCKNLDGQFAAMQNKNTEGHRRIWEHNDEQDKRLNDHETRLQNIEHGERRNTHESE
jgi:hypothetical protein